MSKKELLYPFVPIIVPIIRYKKMFSDPKIHIPKKPTSTGKEIACVAKGSYWYVYFYYTNPATHLRQKYVYKQGINRFETVAERREACNDLKDALQKLLNDGFSPFKEYVASNLLDAYTNEYTVLTAFEAAYKSKYNEWKESTRTTNKSIFDVFKDWLAKTSLDHLPIDMFKRKQILQFLDYMVSVRKANATTRNNYKRTISSILSKIVELDIIEYNPADKVKMLKENPTKNKAFSNKQLIAIKKYLKKNDPYLHQYLKFITYAFMRPVEVCRMKIKDVDFERKLINVDTKTNANFIPIINVLNDVFTELNIENCNSEFFVFSKYMKPSLWQTQTDKAKRDWFGNRFKKLKKHFKFGVEYGIYSFRHNASLNLFFSFVDSGLNENEAVSKLQKIMRHTTPKTTRIYLRDIGAFSVSDYSKDYTFEF